MLLISDDERDYKNLKACGFTNVNWFRSIVLARKYFEANYTTWPYDGLDSYDIMLLGHLSTDTSREKFINIMEKKCENNNSVFSKICHIDGSNAITSDTNLVIGKNKIQRCRIPQLPPEEFYNRLTEALLFTNPLGMFPNREFVAIDNSPVKAMPYPKDLSGIKVLYLGYGLKNKPTSWPFSVVTRENLKDSEIPGYLLDNLGNYDIIIKPHYEGEFSSMLLLESVEQCKKTGRPLVLLVSARITRVLIAGSTNLCLRHELSFNYAGCNLSQDATTSDMTTLNVVYDNIQTPEAMYTIEAVVYQYSRRVNEQGGPSYHLPFASPEELNKGYEIEKQNAAARLEADNSAREKINKINAMKQTVREYLKYEGYITGYLEGLYIIDKGDNVEVQFMINDIPYYSLTFSLDKDDTSFGISTRSSKKPQRRNIYTSKVKIQKGMLPQPTEDEYGIIDLIEKRVSENVKPLVDEGKRRQDAEAETEAQRIQKRVKRPTY